MSGTEQDGRKYASRAELAAMLGVTSTRIDQLRKEMGSPAEEGDGKRLRFFCPNG